MIKVFIVEDEISGQEILKSYLTSISSECEVVGFSENVTDAVNKIDQLKPNIVLMDVHIKNGYAFDVLDNLTYMDFELIFITAFSDYAIKAIRSRAIDYILKPINFEEFKNAIEKAISEFRIKKPIVKIPVTKKDQITFINQKDIMYMEADGAYTLIVTEDSKTLTTKNIGEYETLLDCLNFHRTHNSFIININYIKAIKTGRGGSIELKNGQEIPVSQRRLTDFLRKMTSKKIIREIIPEGNN